MIRRSGLLPALLMLVPSAAFVQELRCTICNFDPPPGPQLRPVLLPLELEDRTRRTEYPPAEGQIDSVTISDIYGQLRGMNFTSAPCRGPLRVTFGGTDWLVTSCSSRRTLTLVDGQRFMTTTSGGGAELTVAPAPGNSASAEFKLRFADGVPQVEGDSESLDRRSRRALRELEALTPQDLADLFRKLRTIE